MDVQGHCHCGALGYELHTAQGVVHLKARACQCGFCRLHGARCVSDPEGRAIIRIHDTGRLERYRFGSRTADFLLCNHCGGYLGAVMSEGDRLYATLNVNMADHVPDLETVEVNYEGRTPEQQRSRRVSVWTPAELVVD